MYATYQQMLGRHSARLNPVLHRHVQVILLLFFPSFNGSNKEIEFRHQCAGS